MSTTKIRSDKSSAALIGSKAPAKASPDQLRKFEEAARTLGTDDDPERFKETVRQMAKAPVTRNAPSKSKKPE